MPCHFPRWSLAWLAALPVLVLMLTMGSGSSLLAAPAATQPAADAQVEGPPVRKKTQDAGDDAKATSSATNAPASSAKSSAPATQPGTRIGWLSIDKPLRQGPSPFAWVSEEDAGLSLAMAVKAIDRVAEDDRFQGLVVSLDAADLSLSQIDALSQAFARIRAKGKQVMVFAESYDMTSYLLACAADQILLQNKGRVELHGLGVEEMYLAGMLSKIGVKADFLQVGKFKGADEALTRTGPSEAWSQNFDALLDDLYKQVTERIVKGRKLTLAQIETLFVDVWYLSDAQLVERKVVDKLCERDLVSATSAAWGEEFEWEDLASPPRKSAPQNPLAMMGLLFQEKSHRVRKPSLAVVWAQGEITSGESAAHAPMGASPQASPRAGLFGGSNIGSKTIIKTLEDARDNSMVKGVVLYVDSPGGSALASELMWQAVRDLAQYKPVYVVVGSMAASGGYYIACAADRIYVCPTSIVGSIGVVGGKIVLGDLYEKLGIAVHRRSRGPMGDMFNSSQPFTAQQRDALQKAFEFTYEQFLDRVTTGRGDKLADVNAVAQGRLFTGAQAVANGMADQVGTVEQAIADMAKELDLEPGRYEIVNLPAPLSFTDFLNHAFGGVHAPGISVQVNVDALTVARQVMGPRAWRSVGPVLSGMLLLQHEPVLTLMPSAIVIR